MAATRFLPSLRLSLRKWPLGHRIYQDLITPPRFELLEKKTKIPSSPLKIRSPLPHGVPGPEGPVLTQRPATGLPAQIVNAEQKFLDVGRERMLVVKDEIGEGAVAGLAVHNSILAACLRDARSTLPR